MSADLRAPAAPRVEADPSVPTDLSVLVDPLDREDLRVRVRKVLDDLLSRQSAMLEELGGDCAPLTEYVADLLAEGKRLRPAFCYWGWRGAGGADDEAALRAAAALELFQAAALVHDDVMDASDTRRGMPAVHRRFASLHRGNGWTGDVERFGQASAILAGDLCLVWSDELLSASGLPPSRLLAGRRVYDTMRTQLMAGQYLDMLEQSVGAGWAGLDPVTRARRVIRFKSAKYTVEHPLLLGGTLAGADDDLLAGYSAFGLPLGEAFQLRDDVLGVFGDPATTGKPAGDDLREGKRTVLVALALRWASPAQAATVRRLLGDPGLDDEGVEAVREVMTDTGALTEVETMIAEDVAVARAALARVPVAPPADEVLADLVDAATARSA